MCNFLLCVRLHLFELMLSTDDQDVVHVNEFFKRDETVSVNVELVPQVVNKLLKALTVAFGLLLFDLE